jgi:hypothetical protein
LNELFPSFFHPVLVQIWDKKQLSSAQVKIIQSKLFNNFTDSQRIDIISSASHPVLKKLCIGKQQGDLISAHEQSCEFLFPLTFQCYIPVSILERDFLAY